MPINILDAEGNTKVRLDDVDSKKDVVIKDGQEVPLSEVVKDEQKKAKKPEPGEE